MMGHIELPPLKCLEFAAHLLGQLTAFPGGGIKADHDSLAYGLYLSGGMFAYDLKEFETFLMKGRAGCQHLHILTEESRGDESAVYVGDDGIHVLPVDGMSLNGAYVSGFTGIEKREIDSIVDVPEHIDIIEADLQGCCLPEARYIG